MCKGDTNNRGNIQIGEKELSPRGRVDHDVASLDVVVGVAALMYVGQSVAELEGVPSDSALGIRLERPGSPPPVDLLGERAAIVVLHDDADEVAADVPVLEVDDVEVAVAVGRLVRL